METLDFSIKEMNLAMRDESPHKLLKWAYQQFGEKMILACSFGAEDVALVDMLCKVVEKPRIFYLDTNKHFHETYETRDRLSEKYRIDFIQMLPALTLEQQADKFGDELWLTDPNQCCAIRKVEPLTRVLKNEGAWITGIRRQQSATRAHSEQIEWDEKFQLVKINPLVYWTLEDVWNYIHLFEVPYNSLHDQNYPSIGCAVCTKPVKPGEDPRSGRWTGFSKTECGLHKGD
ncbi:phosphoadenylyl-sulfate reductase [Ammoniphilus sp. CFH 90114]|uniref:phosphoadenylyl-sulfate reductase n=1 Tax=Ammoniphilus sp. CFH 90114 TaxID=2493665 RepID=UPI00100E6B21|nr:phosphoadenylyl-sulfate reductase [Ammoniphilus sp. CFH 90114]RXT04757.1 phosphoadenylyl-sulfate reductase [Ammoniphilus sp. CFH 90114]